ncbi:patatin-like phospholipase family protein [Nonomuraea roseoviolacea]|uniref:Acylesterase/phospholipase RssA n=1 Tax=Nonomuraea roseoviolacea subsp. carminata TaxID=160689 RepID=A0ABT1KAM6_9ACTN|nr:patatin-like phospholipase family protein [Nonomuraea roseoviolacea]MCP2351077.1 putative acylesterase/phospholipase RssA [Nonomuraea roseoviolacea subsp. carminata]
MTGEHEVLDSATGGHEVLHVLADRVRRGSRPGERRDGHRVALAVEGGGMRGTISAGMALALHESGVMHAFDAVYGASAGAITGAWLLSGTPERLTGWADPGYARAMIRPANLLRGRPVVDVRNLVEHLYREVARMDFDAVLAHPVEYHPLATDVRTGRSTDLRPYVTGPAELRLALRASAALPFLAGPPVELAGRRYYDAGLAESIPYRTALAQGASHVLVLRSRPAPVPGAVGTGAPGTGAGQTGVPGAAVEDVAGTGVAGIAVAGAGARPSYGARLVAATVLRRYPEALHRSYLARAHRLLHDDAVLTRYDRSIPQPSRQPAEGRAPADPAVLSVRPGPGTPRVGRLTRDGEPLRAAFEAGRAAVERLLRPLGRLTAG